jgi:ferredoxin-NADP reductase
MPALLSSTPLLWREATVAAVVPETANATTLRLDVPEWPGHVAGQHVDVRLTAEDGYQAERSYSIASAPEDDHVELTIEVISDGEVSPYLGEDVIVGDVFELRGPIGGHFTWSADRGGPLLLVGGGSGVVPLMAMLRHLRNRDADVEAHLLLSARTWPDALYTSELADLAQRSGVEITFALTREQPEDWTGYRRRVDVEMLREVGPVPDVAPKVFVCGPTGFVEGVADALVALGHPPDTIHAERFGPTGG